MEEIEVKFLNINPAEIQKKLEAVGAKKVGEYFYRRRVFDYPDWRLDEKGAWLRVRDEGDKVTLSFKQRLGMKAHDGSESDEGTKEIEVEVNDFEKTCTLLFEAGLIEKHYAENKRIRWTKENVEFDIDTWPELEPYLEIEAPSWEKIDEVVQWLELNPADKKIFSTNQVYALKGIRVKDYTRLTFDGLAKRPK